MKVLASWLLLLFLCLPAASQVIRPPTSGSSNTGIAPYTVHSTDGAIQMYIEATSAATDYPCFTAGLSGVGASYGACSLTNSNVPANFAAKGSGAINIGNGNFATPIMAYQGILAALPTYPTTERFLNTGSKVSFGLNVGSLGSLVLRPSAATISALNYNGLGAGNGAVDLQIPTAAGFFDSSRVASGANSFAANFNNGAPGQYASAFGNFSYCSGATSFCAGTSTGQGQFGFVTGNNSDDLVHNNTFVHGMTQRAAGGDRQYRRMLGGCTSAASAGATCRLTVNAAAASSTNSFNIGNASSNRSMAMDCAIVAQNIGAGNSARFSVSGLLTRAANTTAWTSTAGVVAGETHGVPGVVGVAASADDTVDGLNLTFTDTTGTSGGFNVVAVCNGVEAG